MPEPAGPDLRFLQANERTLLAWARTALGLLGLGLASARARALLHGDETPSPTAAWTGAAVASLAPVALLVGLARYRTAHRALLEGRATPTSSWGPTVFALLLATLAAAIAGHLALAR